MTPATKVVVLAFSLALAGVGMSFYGQALLARPVSNSTNLFDEPRHPVTDPMWRESRAQTGRAAPAFELHDSDGRVVRLLESCKFCPVVLVFTKDGCPCSIESQPFFNQLAAGTKGRVTFLGVIDGPRHVASKYKDDFKVPYSMLLAEDGAVFKAFRAGQSVYTTLVGTDGKVVRQWPGYNKAMLRELNSELARLTGSSPIKMDLSMAPEKMSSGCAFE